MATTATDPLISLHHKLLQLTRSISDSLTKAPYNQAEGSSFSVKSHLESLLCFKLNDEGNPETIIKEVRDFYLCCSALSSVDGREEQIMSWVPKRLASMAFEAIKELSRTLFCDLDQSIRMKTLKLDDGFPLASNEDKLVSAIMHIVLPIVKDIIGGSAIDQLEDTSTASCARAPVGSAIVAAHQLRWSIERVLHPDLGKLCALVIPCILTALDHWSPMVKGQAMISFIHIAKNMNAAELGSYSDVILDACSRNIAASDELWHRAIEMSVLFVTHTQGKNPRSNWYEKLLNEMLGHLERHPRSKELRVSWLQLIGPIFGAMGLLIVVHFRRIFQLIFKWIHADDDQTVLLHCAQVCMSGNETWAYAIELILTRLFHFGNYVDLDSFDQVLEKVLENLQAILKFTWMRNTLYVERLIDELALAYKEASLRRNRESIRKHIIQIFVLLQRCKGVQFETAWGQHKDDPNLTTLSSSLGQELLDLLPDSDPKGA